MTSTRRPRRSSDEVRERLLVAARELFAEKGYEATTTRDICSRAGVAAQQLFHNFGSKDGLFDAAFVPPLAELVSRYIATFESAAADISLEQRVRVFIDELYGLAEENRTVLLSAVWRDAMYPDAADGPSQVLDHVARTLHEIEAIPAPRPGMDVPAAITAAAGMVFGVVLLDSLLQPAGEPRLSRERLVDEMVASIVHGAEHRPAPQRRRRRQRS